MGAPRRRLSLLLAVVSAVTAPAAALATSGSDATIVNAVGGEMSPDLEGAHSHGIFDVAPRKDQNANGRAVRTVIVRLEHGFRIDARAIRGRCSSSQARRLACPSSSRIGNGTAQATKAGGAPVSLALRLFMAPKPHSGDIGGVVAQITGDGVRGAAKGSMVELHPAFPDLFGYQVSFGGFDQVTGTHLQNLHIDLGGKRSVTRTQRGKRRRVTYHLITNPSICPSGWHFEIELDYADGARHTGGGLMSCTER
jgi:hypothetical protein